MSTQTESTGPPRSGREAAPQSGDRPAPPEHPGEAIREAFSKLAEVREFAAYYIAVRIDSLKLTVRNIGIYAGLGIIGLIAGAAVVVVSVALLMTGIAGAWGALFNGRVWLGDIITGVIFLAIVALGVMVGMRVLTGMFKTRTVYKYEERLRRERERFGRSVKDEAERAVGATPRRPGR